MPAISATLVLTLHKPHYCADCEHKIKGLHVRAFGSACKGDPPWALRVCLDCASRSKDKKIYEAAMSEPSHALMDRVAEQGADDA